MQLVCRKSDGLVKYAFKDSEVIRWEKGILSFPVKALDIKENDYEILVCEKLPDIFTGNLYNFVNGAFEIANQEMYNDLLFQSEKEKLITEIKLRYNNLATAPVLIESENLTFNGGDASASAINSSISMDEMQGLTETKIWDVSNVVHTFSIDVAKGIAFQIANKYRETMYEKQNKLTEINNCVTIDELELLAETLK